MRSTATLTYTVVKCTFKLNIRLNPQSYEKLMYSYAVHSLVCPSAITDYFQCTKLIVIFYTNYYLPPPRMNNTDDNHPLTPMTSCEIVPCRRWRTDTKMAGAATWTRSSNRAPISVESTDCSANGCTNDATSGADAGADEEDGRRIRRKQQLPQQQQHRRHIHFRRTSCRAALARPENFRLASTRRQRRQRQTLGCLSKTDGADSKWIQFRLPLLYFRFRDQIDRFLKQTADRCRCHYE